MSALLTGMPVDMSNVLRDGQMLVVAKPHRRLIIGTRPLTDVEFAGAEGRYIVRRGMADVLDWLGEAVGPEPQRSGKGEAVIQVLRRAANQSDERADA